MCRERPDAVTTNALHSTDNNRFHDIALFHNAAGCCFLNGSHHNVADICIPPARTTENANAHKFLRTGVVGNFEVGLLLNHSVFLLSD